MRTKTSSSVVIQSLLRDRRGWRLDEGLRLRATVDANLFGEGHPTDRDTSQHYSRATQLTAGAPWKAVLAQRVNLGFCVALERKNYAVALVVCGPAATLNSLPRP